MLAAARSSHARTPTKTPRATSGTARSAIRRPTGEERLRSPKSPDAPLSPAPTTSTASSSGHRARNSWSVVSGSRPTSQRVGAHEGPGEDAARQTRRVVALERVECGDGDLGGLRDLLERETAALPGLSQKRTVLGRLNVGHGFPDVRRALEPCQTPSGGLGRAPPAPPARCLRRRRRRNRSPRPRRLPFPRSGPRSPRLPRRSPAPAPGAARTTAARPSSPRGRRPGFDAESKTVPQTA